MLNLLQDENVSDRALVVPTRSLANILLEEYNVAQLKAGHTAWLPPVIMTWSDLVTQLWTVNQVRQASLSNLSLLSGQQSLVLWERVLNAAKREEDELRLLNVMQTAKAAQTARQTCLDWQLHESSLIDFANLDLNQFLQWQQSFEQVCAEVGMVDFATATMLLTECSDLRPVYSHICLYAFDLKTSAQTALLEVLARDGAQISFESPTLLGKKGKKGKLSKESEGSPQNSQAAPNSLNSYQLERYVTDRDELYSVLNSARALLAEQADAKIGIVIPDLQNRLTEVTQAAREVFYPSLTPLLAAHQHDAYRVSLGKPLEQWAATGVALRAIDLLKPTITAGDFSLLIRSQHIFMSKRYSLAIADLLIWLAEKRIHTIKISELSGLLDQFLAWCSEYKVHNLKQCKGLCERLNGLLEKRLALLSPNQGSTSLLVAPSVWGERFIQWLEEWQWVCGAVGDELTSEQYQLEKRFGSCLRELGDLDCVLRQCGLSRAIEWLNKLCNDTVFLPQAEPAPILISGVYEAIGREVDVLLLTGMTEDFPSAFPKTAFIPANALLNTAHPSANHERHYQQMSQVLKSLLASAKEHRISYAQKLRLDPEVKRSASPFFRNAPITDLPSQFLQANPVELDHYQDDIGQAWPEGELVKHGMSVFKEQSSCAFKAFATHRLKCRHIDEPEFGLEASAQGTVIHHLLDSIWEQLGDSSGLEEWFAKSENAQTSELGKLVKRAVEELDDRFNSEQIKLVQRERVRYVALIQEWLAYEAKRPVGFAVVEREWKFSATLGGIEYRGVVDRIDAVEGGSIVILDYKTGNVNRSDWTGERLVNPQMPLYFLAHQQNKQRAADGITYAQVRRSDMAFSELAEDGLLVKANSYTAKRAADWQDMREQWQPILEQLADDFMQGKAEVDPVNELACSYCPYEGMCRIKQLQGRLSGEEGDYDSK